MQFSLLPSLGRAVVPSRQNQSARRPYLPRRLSNAGRVQVMAPCKNSMLKVARGPAQYRSAEPAGGAGAGLRPRKVASQRFGCQNAPWSERRHLTPPSSGRSKGRFAPFGPPLMSNVRRHLPSACKTQTTSRQQRRSFHYSLLAQRSGDSGARIRLLARSVGLGPAIVTDHYFCRSPARLAFPDPTSVASTLLKQLIGDSLQYRILNEGYALRQYALPVGAELILLDVQFPTLTVQTIGVVDAYMQDVSLHLKYKSLYGEEFSADINSPGDA